MAYRPSLIKPPVHRSPRALLEARMQRQALVKALSDRLSFLLSAFAQAGSAQVPPGAFRPRAEIGSLEFPRDRLRPPPAGRAQFRPPSLPPPAVTAELLFAPSVQAQAERF